jgi:hypothetical protein
MRKEENRMKQQVHYTREQLIRWLKSRWPDVGWDKIEKDLPPIIWRSRWDKLAERFGLPYSRKYVQNLDSLGQGPGSIDV